MSWEKIDSELKKKYGRHYVSCHEPEEREFIRVLITIHFPQFRKSKIESAITQACKELESPRDRSVFLNYLAGILKMGAPMKATKQKD